ncbi:MAG: glycosyltransferase [Clostridia bacterium]|nr:glycosyltransferase [Clostridia bacterium]
MKKILFLIPNLAHGGAERVLVNLANNLNPEKYDVTVQTLFDVGVNRQYLKPHVHYVPGYPRHIRGTTTFMKLFSPRILYRFWIREEYDILVSYLEGPTSRILAGCTDPSKKKVAWLHIELNTPKQASIGFRSPEEARKLYNTYDRLIAVAGSVRDVFRRSLPVDVPIDVFYNTNETEKILEKAKLPPEDSSFRETGIRICSVAKLISTKGFDRLLNVHKRLKDEGYPHTVYILGIGEDEKALRQKIREYGVEDSFILLGFRDNPYQYVSRCDLYVCSSRREGFSTAVTESLIVGTPVVSTDCSGAKELLGEQNEYGLVVENSEEGIYQGMKQMLADPEILQKYRELAKQRGKAFSKENTVKAVEEMFDSL